MDPGLIVPVVMFLVMGVVAIVIVAVNQWSKVRQAEMETVPKQQMLERGMSAEEIATVLNASPRRSLERSPSESEANKR
jgi:hypothetical protein